MTIAQDILEALTPKQQPAPYDTQAVITRIEDGTAWVHIPGGIDETPVKLTIDASVGETVQVRISDGTAFLCGNASAPPTDDKRANRAYSTAEEAGTVAKEAGTVAKEAGTVAKEAGQTAEDAKKVANNYLSADETGIMVADLSDGQQTPSQATGRNVFIDNDSVDIRKGQTVLASFGEETFIKNENGLELAHFGYGETNEFTQIVDNPYYTIGARKTGKTYDPQKTYSVGDIALFPDGKNRVCISNSTGSGTWIVINGGWSVAEGADTTASGYGSHAEGGGSKALGGYSHAEGYQSLALDSYSHAEGFRTKADMSYSHAEGYLTEASGQASHAEGYNTKANGRYSHSSNYGTFANRASQTAVGEYNVIDTGGTAQTRGDYAIILGNGTSNSARSNALAVDWNGNVKLAGDVYVGCNDDSTGGSNLTTLIATANSTITSLLSRVESVEISLNDKLDLAGGTMTGQLAFSANKYIDDRTAETPTGGAIDLHNGDIVRFNAMYAADKATGIAEAINFKHDDNMGDGNQTWDSIWANSGNLYFAPNSGPAHKVWHEGNLPMTVVSYPGIGTDAQAIPNGVQTTKGSITFEAGTYLILVHGWFSANATGVRRMVLATTDGGSTNVNPFLRDERNAMASGQTRLQFCGIHTFKAQTTVYLTAYQNSGGDLGMSVRYSYIKIA